VPGDRQSEVGRGCRLQDWRGPPDARGLLQAARGPAREEKLGGAQRVVYSDSGADRDGAVVVSGWRVGVRLDRRGASEGDRVFRPGADRFHEAGGWWDVVGVLVERQHLQFGDHAWA